MTKAKTVSTLSRRAALGSIAAIAAIVPASAVAAAVSHDDPVYAAIEAYKRGAAVHREYLDKGNVIEKKWAAEGKKVRELLEANREEATAEMLRIVKPTHPELTPDQAFELLCEGARRINRDTGDFDEAQRLFGIGCKAEWDALEALLDTVPTSARGAADQIAFLLSDNVQDCTGVFEEPDMTMRLLDSLETFLRQAAL